MTSTKPQKIPGIAQRTLNAYVFSDIPKANEGPAVRDLAVSATTAMKYTRHACVVVVADELGNEVRRSSFGKVSTELWERVNHRFPA